MTSMYDMYMYYWLPPEYTFYVPISSLQHDMMTHAHVKLWNHACNCNVCGSQLFTFMGLHEVTDCEFEIEGESDRHLLEFNNDTLQALPLYANCMPFKCCWSCKFVTEEFTVAFYIYMYTYRYAAELSGISNGVAEVSGIIAPLVATLMTPNVSTSCRKW